MIIGKKIIWSRNAGRILLALSTLRLSSGKVLLMAFRPVGMGSFHATFLPASHHSSTPVLLP